MKNRVAAQTARDRKKDRTQKLEMAIRLLLEENQSLRTENGQLRDENSRLRQSSNGVVNLAFKEEVVANINAPQRTAAAANSDAFGSAASVSEPLPWERASERKPQQKPAAMQRLLSLLTILATTSTCRPSSTTSSTAPTVWTSTRSATKSSRMSTRRRAEDLLRSRARRRILPTDSTARAARRSLLKFRIRRPKR